MGLEEYAPTSLERAGLQVGLEEGSGKGDQDGVEEAYEGEEEGLELLSCYEERVFDGGG